MALESTDEEASAPRIIRLGRFPDLDIEPFVEVVLDSIANTIDALAGGWYTNKDRSYALWAFHHLDKAGYALDPGVALVWFRRDGRIHDGADRVVMLVGQTRGLTSHRNPYKKDIIAIWRSMAERSLAVASEKKRARR